MKIDTTEMGLAQALNAIQQLQTWLDEAHSDRVMFTERWAMREDSTENGTLMAHLWREKSIEHLLTCLRESICERFDPSNTLVK